MGRYDVYLYSPWGSRDLLCIPVIPGRGAYVGPTFTATRWGQFAEAPGERKRLAMHRYEFELKDGDLVGRSSHITLDVNGKQQRRVSYDEFWPRIEPWRPDSPSWLKGIPLSYRNGDWYWGSATLQRPRGVPGFTLTAPKGPGRRDVVVNGEVFVMPADWNSLRFHEWLAKESHGFAIDARLFDRPAPWEGAPGYDEGGTGLHIDDRYFGIMAYQASRATTGKVSAQLYGKYEWMVHGDGLVAVGSVPAGGRRVRWGVVRRTGEQVTPVQYDAIKILPGGLAAVGTIATGTADISYRLIDASGAQLSPGSWDLVEPLPEGNIALARLPSGGRDATWSVMAPNGEVLEEGLDTRQVARRRCRR